MAKEKIEFEIKNSTIRKASFALMGIIAMILAFNQYPAGDAVTVVIPRGIPGIYGDELGVSFENPVESLDILASLDPTYGRKRIQLETEEEITRYIAVGSLIACEYCCGASSLVFPNGQAACGCAHSQAMRGLSAYLVKYHGDDFTDDYILRELARWKGLFFPKQMMTKYIQENQAGQFSPDIAALMLDFEGARAGGGQGGQIVPANLQDLPDMVGGC
ncbi:hypothetical protein J4475_03720 [Candidatus Woesearchaeota archaeon]|nr:hypothetical protein [Candidatus Woesearchaeota archaeon]